MHGALAPCIGQHVHMLACAEAACSPSPFNHAAHAPHEQTQTERRWVGWKKSVVLSGQMIHNYIHIFSFSELIPPPPQKKQNHISVTRRYFGGELIFRYLHITYSFVIQSIAWKNCLGIISLESLISVTWNHVFELISHEFPIGV